MNINKPARLLKTARRGTGGAGRVAEGLSAITLVSISGLFANSQFFQNLLGVRA
jgi:hypothetical protein